MDVYCLQDLLSCASLGVVYGDVVIRSGIKEIEGIHEITGSLGITSTEIVSLGSLRIIGGDFWVSFSNKPSNLKSLGLLSVVRGNMSLRFCTSIESIFPLEYVGENLSLRDTPVIDLGILSKVGNNFHLPNHLRDAQITNDIFVGGAVKYWKNQKHYLDKEANFFPVDIMSLRKTEILLHQPQITGEIAIKLGHISEFTAFGRCNLIEIIPFIEKEIDAFVKRNGFFSYLDAFFDGLVPYNKDEADNRYCKLFSSPESYKFYTSLWSYTHSANIEVTSPVFMHAIAEQTSKFFRPAEDNYRVSIGIPKIGEGWVSETDLFHKVKDYFSNYEVIQHGRPEWLGRQHLDIYFPTENIAIEYQGAQHYAPVSIFGGEEGFVKTQERDKLKLEKCNINNCILIYVDETMSFDDVAYKIKDALRNNEK